MMRISQIDSLDSIVLRHVKVPMREPFRISNGTVSEKESIVIELHSDDFVGYGEASPLGHVHDRRRRRRPV